MTSKPNTTPNHNSLGNVSGELNAILKELPVRIDDFLHVYYLNIERTRNGDWLASYQCDTVYEGIEYMPIEGEDNVLEGGKTIEEACAKLIPRVKKKLRQLQESDQLGAHSALNNGSGNTNVPMPSEPKEAKPAYQCACGEPLSICHAIKVNREATALSDYQDNTDIVEKILLNETGGDIGMTALDGAVKAINQLISQRVVEELKAILRRYDMTQDFDFQMVIEQRISELEDKE